jgi:hypothetical protein
MFQIDQSSGNPFNLVLHGKIIFIGGAGHHDSALFPFLFDIDAKPLMGHEKRYVTPDNQYNKSGVNDPHSRVFCHLEPGIIPVSVF